LALTHPRRRVATILVSVGTVLACSDRLGPLPAPGVELIPTGLVTTLDPAAAAGAPYTIDSLRVQSDSLYLGVSYAGGCRQHQFQLVLSTSFMESEPVQTRAVLSHDDHEDACEALLQDVLSATLEPIKHEWQRSYQSPSGTILLRLWTAAEPITIPYTF
jgi:hypothetical protein